MSKKEDKLAKIEENIIRKIEQKLDKNFTEMPPKVKNNIQKRKSHYSNKHYKKNKQKESSELLLRKEYRLRKNKSYLPFMIHSAIFASTNLFLIFVYFMSFASTPEPWFLYPLLGWGIPLIVHLMITKYHNKKLDIMYEEKGLDVEMVKAKQIGSSKKFQSKDETTEKSNDDDDLFDLSEPFYSYVEESNEISDSLMRQIKSSKNIDSDLIEQIKGSLTHYKSKIVNLAKNSQTLMKSIEYFENNDPERDIEIIKKQLQNEKLDASTTAEYEKALSLLNKQIESLLKLENVYNNIEAKIKTSLISLRTLQLDFVRLQYITDESAENAINSINKNTEEIDEYIDLLSESLKDIDEQI